MATEKSCQFPSKVRGRTAWTVVGVLAATILGGLWFYALSAVGGPIFEKRAQVAPLVRVAELPDSSQLQKGQDNRLVLIGDIHGMRQEFKKLLKKIDYNNQTDQLVLLGDFITKGPDSLGVIDDAIELGAACVRGNHEDEILSMYVEEHNLHDLRTYPPFASEATHVFGQEVTATVKPTTGPHRDEDLAHLNDPTPVAKTPMPERAAAQATAAVAAALELDESLDFNLPSALDARYDEISDNDDPVNAMADRYRDAPLARAMKKHQIDYVQGCPLILKLGQVSKKGIEAVACHAGLIWTIHDLEDQDPEMVMRVRGMLPPKWSVPTEESEGEPWFEMWKKEQKHRPKSHRYEVFYGHDASKGLQIHKYSKGLDSRCVKGDRLSAMVITVSDEGKYHQKLYQVDC